MIKIVTVGKEPIPKTLKDHLGKDILIDFIQPLRRKYSPELFSEFRELLEENTEVVLEFLDSRWLVSVADTFADYGTTKEKGKALIISTYITMLRTMDSIKKMKGLGNSFEYLDLDYEDLPMYDGLFCITTLNQDTYQNLCKRILDYVDKESFLGKVWLELLERSRNQDYHIRYLMNSSPNPDSIFPVKEVKTYNTPWKDFD